MMLNDNLGDCTCACAGHMIEEWTTVAAPPGGPVGQGAPGSWGGHAIPIISYDPRGLTVITWGAKKRMPWQFLDTYCDEGYAVLSNDWVNSKTTKAPDNFDLAQLQADLNEIGAKPSAVGRAA